MEDLPQIQPPPQSRILLPPCPETPLPTPVPIPHCPSAALPVAGLLVAVSARQGRPPASPASSPGAANVLCGRFARPLAEAPAEGLDCGVTPFPTSQAALP